MIPFLHLGPLTIPTFGLMVAAGLLVSAYVLQADFDRRRDTFLKSGYLKESNEPSHHDEGFLVIGIAGLSGLVGARLYHVLESPRELMANPSLLVSRFGFAWFGGFLGGFVALIFLAKYYRIPALEFMDVCSPAAAVGYAIGRIGCLLSGDGDYGVPTKLPWGMSFPNGVVPTTARVHPTPVVELNRAVAVAMSSGLESGLALLDALDGAGGLAGYHLLSAARAELGSTWAVQWRRSEATSASVSASVTSKRQTKRAKVALRR